MSDTMDIVMRLLAIVVPVLSLVVSALVGWVWLLWQDHNRHTLYVAENMLKPGALRDLTEEVHSLRDVVYRIAVKMEVPVFTEKYQR